MVASPGPRAATETIVPLLARVLLLAGLMISGWQAVVSGLAFAGRRADPAAAVARAPGNALALAALAQQQLAKEPARAEATARAALRRDATNAAAAGSLSIALAQNGEPGRSRALLDYSLAMSRRDMPAQLWAIETAVQRGDIPAALHHYDVALRTNRTAPTLLFPILVGAIDTPAVRHGLARLLGRGTPWAGSFLDYITSRTGDVATASQLVLDIYGAGGSVARGPLSVLTQRLVEANDPAGAWRLFVRAEPAAARLTLRNGRFDRSIDPPTPFDWQLSDSGEAHAAILPDRRGGVMQVDARDGSGGVVARQRLALGAGDYVLQFAASAMEEATLGDSRFELWCLPARRQIAQIAVAGPAGQSRRRGGFTVPRGCDSQSIEIVLIPGRTEAPIEATLSDVALVRTASNGSLQ